MYVYSPPPPPPPTARAHIGGLPRLPPPSPPARSLLDPAPHDPPAGQNDAPGPEQVQGVAHEQTQGRAVEARNCPPHGVGDRQVDHAQGVPHDARQEEGEGEGDRGVQIAPPPPPARGRVEPPGVEEGGRQLGEGQPGEGPLEVDSREHEVRDADVDHVMDEGGPVPVVPPVPDHPAQVPLQVSHEEGGEGGNGRPDPVLAGPALGGWLVGPLGEAEGGPTHEDEGVEAAQDPRPPLGPVDGGEAVRGLQEARAPEQRVEETVGAGGQAYQGGAAVLLPQGDVGEDGRRRRALDGGHRNLRPHRHGGKRRGLNLAGWENARLTTPRDAAAL